MNLWQKIVEVRKVAEGFNKDGASYGYKYVTGNQVLGKIKDKMNELNLLLVPSTTVGEHHTHAYKTSKGKDALDFVVKGEMAYTWINGDEPSEREVVSWSYYGQQDDISKAYGSALTYSERYFLLKCLGLPTDEDDPDAKTEKNHQNTNLPQDDNKAAIERETRLNSVMTLWMKLGNYQDKELANAEFADFLKAKNTSVEKVTLSYLAGLEKTFNMKLKEKSDAK